MTSTAADTIGAPVLFDERPADNGSRIGIAVLSAQKALNSLTVPMIQLLYSQLLRWREDERIVCVVLRGEGERAFCAGADIRSLRTAVLEHGAKAGPSPHALAFFSEEYRLDFLIHTYPKPMLVWGSGVVMGGGVGLFVGASHRVLTETSRLAMPEISIGLFPDVGGSWFLRRMPHRAGLFLGLTGASISAADARYLGLGDWLLRSGDYSALLSRLATLDWKRTAAANHAALSNALLSQEAHAASVAPPPVSMIRNHADEIARLTRADSLRQVVGQITAYAGDVAWLKQAAAGLAQGSPTTAALTWELWHRAEHLGLADVFRLELVVALRCCEHPDFVEGVRALLVDKDNSPRWTPPTIGEVTTARIDEYFRSPWSGRGDDINPLSDLSAGSVWRTD